MLFNSRYMHQRHDWEMQTQVQSPHRCTWFENPGGGSMRFCQILGGRAFKGCENVEGRVHLLGVLMTFLLTSCAKKFRGQVHFYPPSTPTPVCIYESPVPAKFSSSNFSRFKSLDRSQLDCFNGKKWFDGYIHNYSLFLRQCKVNQPMQNQRKKGAKKTRKKHVMKGFGCSMAFTVYPYPYFLCPLLMWFIEVV